jgi:hypothetical protein
LANFNQYQPIVHIRIDTDTDKYIEMHAKHYRSSFESMVFAKTGALDVPGSVCTEGSVYGWIKQLRPSAISGEDPIQKNVADMDAIRNERNGIIAPVAEPDKATIRPQPVYRRKFGVENLFEVVVMYLFNGLRSDGVDANGVAVPGTTALLHYIVYLVPEADKLRVVYLDEKRTYFERMKNVRVMFDHEDYRFRVLVRKGGDDGGWIDIGLQLRTYFTGMIKKLVTDEDAKLDECWVKIVKNFREHMVKSLCEHTGQPTETVVGWVLRDDDIQWEVSNYAGGVVEERDLSEQTTTDEEKDQLVKPFLVSYWADNYLEFNSYKLSRMFNGLVGYGEYLYERDNNFCRKASNNFFTFDDTEKKWLWEDLPREMVDGVEISESVETSENTTATEEERGSVLEAVIKDGKIYLTHAFWRMVTRRHLEAWALIENNSLTKVCERILSGTTGRGYSTDQFQTLFSAIQSYLRQQMQQVFAVNNGAREDVPMVYYVDPSTLPTPATIMSEGDGVVKEDVLWQMYKQFLTECFRLASLCGITDFNDNVPIPRYLRHDITRMLKSGVHFQREKWIISEHTTILGPEYMADIRQTYNKNFWNPTGMDRSSAGNASAQRTYASVSKRPIAWGGMGYVSVENNSSLNETYTDPAINTHALGYVKWARFNHVPCTPFALGYSEDIIQKYYDRKVNYDEIDNYVSSCDLTSVLRATQTLVRGFDRFIISIANVVEEAGTQVGTKTRYSPNPAVQTTRCPYQTHGFAYPLEGNCGVYERVVNVDCGKRKIHSDDLLVFGNVLFTVVNNPGVFNLFNSAAGDTVVATRKDQKRGDLSSASQPVRYVPMTANIGFVNSGKKVADGDINSISRDNNTTWSGISKMTYTKLRVGIMDQTAVHHSSRWYLNEVLNNTRPTTSETALHGWDSFMFRVYQEEGFADLFHGQAERKKKQHEVYNDMPPDVEYLSLQDQIEKDALELVDRLHMCCTDAGLQVTNPDNDKFAFSSLHNQGIQIPEDKSHQLFYILFGETICKLADDLMLMPARTVNTAQELQLRSNEMMAQHLRDQVSHFLEHLTEMFFSGALHKNLVTQLQLNKHDRKLQLPNPLDDMPNKWTFEKITDNMQEAAHYMRHTKSRRCIKDTPWKSRSVSSQKTKEAVLSMFKEKHADPVTAPMDDGSSAVNMSAIENLDWGDETATDGPHHVFEPASDVQYETPELKAALNDLSASRAVFYPYIQVYKRVAAYFEKGVVYRANTSDMQLGVDTDLFYENRMLSMRICEEQMHLIQRHQSYVKDYPDSMAWDFIFDMFMYQRQLFAELRAPVGAWKAKPAHMKSSHVPPTDRYQAPRYTAPTNRNQKSQYGNGFQKIGKGGKPTRKPV